MSKISDIEVFDIGIHRYRSQNSDIEVKTSISVYTDIEVNSFDIGKNFDIGIYRYRSSKLRYREIFDIVTYRYRSSDLRYRQIFDIVTYRYRSSELRYRSLMLFHEVRYRSFELRYRSSISYPISKLFFRTSISKF